LPRVAIVAHRTPTLVRALLLFRIEGDLSAYKDIL
jgi:hypothetical protein